VSSFGTIFTGLRRATEDSILAIQIFDQKKFKKKDQGFLGVINVRIGSVMDLDIGGDGMHTKTCVGSGVKESLTMA
jgi:E3 ubiquitin-protein ligase NEDD4